MADLKAPCQHGTYDEHYLNYHHEEPDYCPGGTLLPPDSLVIVKEGGKWQLSPQAWHVLNASAAFGVPTGSVGLLDALAAAQPGTPSG